MTAASNNSMQLEGKTILLGITGGGAAPKSCKILPLAPVGLPGGAPRL